MRICSSCQTENQDDYKFCVSCGTRCDGKIECLKCKKEISENLKFCPYCGTKLKEDNTCNNCHEILPSDFEFCPNCGTKRHHAHGYVKKGRSNNCAIKIFNLISKITVATVTVIMLLVFLFAPIYRSKIDKNYTSMMGASEEMYIYQSGVHVISNGFRALSDFDSSDLQELYKKRSEKVEEKFGEIDDPSNKQIQKAINILAPYDFTLVDSADINDDIIESKYNHVLQAQVVISAIGVIGVVVLFILASVFSIIAIFKKDYSYQKLIVLYVVILGIVALLVTVMRLPGISAFATATAGSAAITVLILLITVLTIVYLYSIFNKKISFNLVNLLSKGIGMVVLFVTLILASGNLMNAEVSNTHTSSFTLKPAIQDQMEVIDVISEYSDISKWQYKLNSLLKNYDTNNTNFRKSEATYTYNLNYVYSSDKVISDLMAPELIFTLGIVYYLAGVSLAIGLIFVTLNLYRNKPKKSDFITMISSLSLFLVTVILTIVIVVMLNSVSALSSGSTSITTKVSPMIVSAVILILGFVIYTPILSKKAVKKEVLEYNY